MGRTNLTSKSTLNEDTQIDFKHIVPQWFERLNKLFHENVDTDYFLWKHYSELTVTRSVWLGRHMVMIHHMLWLSLKMHAKIVLSGTFSFQIRVLDKKGIEMTIDKFAINWNEKHRSSG
jgi:hypothetical protein